MNRAGTTWWAAVAAPLVGVPLLVGMLALTAPARSTGDAEVSPVTEPGEVFVVQTPITAEECEAPQESGDGMASA